MSKKFLTMLVVACAFATAGAVGAFAAGGNNAGDSGSASTACATPSEISGSQNVAWSPTSLWPPNHKLQTITISANDTEGIPGETLTVTVNSITSTDGFVGTAANGVGNSASAPEDGTLATTTVTVPAERAGTDLNGNAYDIHVTCSDDDGSAGADLAVTVPHDQGQ
jgi:hypothetical protein